MRKLLATDTLPVAAGVAAASFLAAHPGLRDFAITFSTGWLLAAALGGTAVTFLVARLLHQPPAVSYAASAAGLIVLLLAAGAGHAGAVVRDVAQGPNRVLTETLPLTGSAAVMAILLALTWLAAASTSELLLRSRRPSLGLAVPVALYVICFAISARAPGRDDASGPLLLAVLAGMALARQHFTARRTMLAPEADADRPNPYRGVAVGAACVVAVATGLAFAVPALPSMSRPAASLHRSAPTDMSTVIDPVGAMADFRDGRPHSAPHTALTVQLSPGSTGYLGMAVLDDYDGGSWRFTATFQPTGGRIPAPAPSATSPEVNVRQRVAISSPLPIPLLPAVDRPATVTGLAVVTDPSTGMLLPGRPANLPIVYTVESGAPRATLPGLPSADGLDPVGTDPADSNLPPNATAALATTLRFLSTLTRQRPAPTVAFLQSALAALQDDERRVDPSLPAPTGVKGRPSRRPTPTTTVPPAAGTLGGVSLSEVINAVTVNRAATPEQFATFFAMVARYLGVPARLVTGFRLSSPGGGVLPGGVYHVRNTEAWTWVEVPVSGAGWVVADPTPRAAIAVATPPPQQVQAPATTIPPRQANAVPGDAASGGHALAKPAPAKRVVSHSFPWWLLALIALAGTVLLAGLAGPGQAGARRWWRRRSRRSDRAEVLAVGAWLQLLDDLDRAGMPSSPGWTSVEVAREAGMHFGSDVEDPVRTVGTLADVAVFSSAAHLDWASAVEAWQTRQLAARKVMRGLDRRQRLRAWLSVGHAPRLPY